MVKEEQPKKFVTIGRIIIAVFSIIGVTGIIAILEYEHKQEILGQQKELLEQQREREKLDYEQKQREIAEQEYQQSLKIYQQKLKEWNDFSPRSLLGSSQEKTLRGADRFDLETGLRDSAPASNKRWDLIFGCGPYGYEYLRALNDASWYEFGDADIEEISYRDLRDADYSVTINSKTGYEDIFYAHRGNVPTDGYVYFVKTSDNNVAKLQIIDYTLYNNDPNPMICRDMNIQYEVFPIEEDPPKPTPPSR